MFLIFAFTLPTLIVLDAVDSEVLCEDASEGSCAFNALQMRSKALQSKPTEGTLVDPRARAHCLPHQDCWPLRGMTGGLDDLTNALSPAAEVLDGATAQQHVAFVAKCLEQFLSDPAAGKDLKLQSLTAHKISELQLDSTKPKHRWNDRWDAQLPWEFCEQLLQENFTQEQSFFSSSLNYSPAKYKTPGMVVVVATEEDVRVTLDFARSHNIALAVRNTGHGYDGQSGVEGGIVLDVSKLDFVKPDVASQTVLIGGGARLGELYNQASKAGFIVSGGQEMTVGAVGCILGGCHAELARKYGYGADQVVSFTALVPGSPQDGGARLVFANATHNADLFWAVPGGGPGFAVVTAMTLKMHPFIKANASTPPGTVYTFWADFCPDCNLLLKAKPNGSPEYQECMKRSLKRIILNRTWWDGIGPNWSGYKLSCWAEMYYSGEDLEADLAKEEMQLLRPVHYATYSSQFELHSKQYSPQNYSPATVISNVIPQMAELDQEASADALVKAACSVNANCAETLVVLCFGGKGLEDSGRNAVGDGLRKGAGFEFIIKQSATDTALKDSIASFAPKYIETVNRAGQILYPAFKGSYLNEWTGVGGLNDIKDWQVRFWGAQKYEKLLRIKKKYDPCNLLGVTKSVGSDLPPAAGCN